ncbi:MAG: THUMP domain-containing protein [Rhodocyclaceae bacterium]|nr:THUMP domain-containing protein [Rhodocyclaceae bacterium]
MSAHFATCPRGLEALLAEEIAAAGGDAIAPTGGGVGFRADLATCYRLNLESRIASRILRRVCVRPYRDEEDLYRLAYETDWPSLFSVEHTIRVDVTAQHAPVKSLAYVTLRIKDAVCDRFRTACGKRPSVDTAAPGVRIHLYLDARRAALYLDTSGEPLWRRGEKIAKIAAPLKENLAAGILRLAGWRAGTPLFDPMCGSGTFLLEAAGMSLERAPGLARAADAFGFCRFLDFDAKLWRRLRAEAMARVRRVASLPLWGADLDADAVARTRQNLAHAGLAGAITVVAADFLALTPPAQNGLLVANPPYGERLGEKERLLQLYPRWGDHLKRHWVGWQAWILSADRRLPEAIGLRPMRRIPLRNGALDCRLYGFPIVAGAWRGGRVSKQMQMGPDQLEGQERDDEKPESFAEE